METVVAKLPLKKKNNKQEFNLMEKQGMSVATIIGIIFVVLKLCGLINWSWYWVLSPFWIEIAVVILFTFLIYVIAKR